MHINYLLMLMFMFMSHGTNIEFTKKRRRKAVNLSYTNNNPKSP